MISKLLLLQNIYSRGKWKQICHNYQTLFHGQSSSSPKLLTNANSHPAHSRIATDRMLYLLAVLKLKKYK